LGQSLGSRCNRAWSLHCFDRVHSDNLAFQYTGHLHFLAGKLRRFGLIAQLVNLTARRVRQYELAALGEAMVIPAANRTAKPNIKVLFISSPHEFV
jgi:hypothetical protein